MDNQHRKIKGYRELSQEDIDAMNKVKELSAQVGELVNDIRRDLVVDHRWVAIAATDLQKGFMSLTRSIAQPEFF